MIYGPLYGPRKCTIRDRSGVRRGHSDYTNREIMSTFVTTTLFFHYPFRVQTN